MYKEGSCDIFDITGRCECTDEISIVCGKNGKEYENMCKLECAGAIFMN